MLRPCVIWLLLIGLIPAGLQGSASGGSPLPLDALLRLQPNEYVYSVVFSPDGKTLASGSRDNTINLWETATGKNVGTLKGHSGAVCSVAFSPDGKILASASMDKTVRLWEVASGKEIRTSVGHQKSVRCVAFSPGGKTLASASDDMTIRLWDSATGKEIRSLTGPQDAVESVAFSPEGKMLASVGGITTRLWDVGSGKECHKWTGAVLSHDDTPFLVHSVAFSPDGRTLASGVGNFIRLWDVATGKEVVTLRGHEGLVVINSLAFSPDGRALASASGPSSFMDNGEEKCIRLWNLATGRAIRAWGGHPDGASSLAFSPDGKTLASGGDQGVLVWKTPAAEQKEKE